MKTILLVDDNPAILELLQDILSSGAFRIKVAHDGREALAIAAREPVDLVLLDVVLPGLGGHEVCRSIKKRSPPPGTPVIMISAVAQPSDVAAALLSGADVFLGKPFSPATLLDLVRDALGLTSEREGAD